MISYLAGTVKAIGRGRFTIGLLHDDLGVGYEVRFGASLDPVMEHSIACWVVHSCPQSGDQVLYGYASSRERELALLAEMTPKVGPGSAHKLVAGLGAATFEKLVTGSIPPSSVKVKGVSKATIEEVIKTVLPKLTGRTFESSGTKIKLLSALDAMGLKPDDYSSAIDAVLVAHPEGTTSELLSIVLKQGNQ